LVKAADTVAVSFVEDTTATTGSINGEDPNYTSLNGTSTDGTTNNYVTGSFAGKTLHFFNVIPTLTFVSSSISLKSDSAMKQADATLVFKVKANGANIYIGKTHTNLGTVNQNLDGTDAVIGVDNSSAVSISSDATSVDANSYVIYNGEEKTVTLTFLLDPANAGFTSANISAFK